MQLFQSYRAICIGLLLSVMVTVSSCLEETNPCTSYILFNRNLLEPGWELSSLTYETNQGLKKTITKGNVEIHDSTGVVGVINIKVNSTDNFRLTFTRPCVVGRPEHGSGYIVASINGLPHEDRKIATASIGTKYGNELSVNFFGPIADSSALGIISLSLKLKR